VSWTLLFYFLTYTEPDGVGFSSSILLCMSVDFKADVFRSQMVVELTSPHITRYRHTKHMLPHNHDGLIVLFKYFNNF
jgi:hypothetical protein